MCFGFDPFRLLLISISGWMSQQQRDTIDYLQEENPVVRSGADRRTGKGGDPMAEADLMAIRCPYESPESFLRVHAKVRMLGPYAPTDPMQQPTDPMQPPGLAWQGKRNEAVGFVATLVATRVEI